MHQPYDKQEEAFMLDMQMLSKQAPMQWLRDAASTIHQTGYLSLSEFFDMLDDLALSSIMQSIRAMQSDDYDEEYQRAELAIKMLIILLGQGNAMYFSTVDDMQEPAKNMIAYFLWEEHARTLLSDKELRSYRARYTMDKYPDFIDKYFEKG